MAGICTFQAHLYMGSGDDYLQKMDFKMISYTTLMNT